MNKNEAVEALADHLLLIGSYRQNIDALHQLGRNYRSIVNFGCNIGQETLALMWLLDSDEAVGIDLDTTCIEQAQRSIPPAIDSFRQQLYWTKQIRTYGEQLKLDNMSFRLADMTKGTNLPSDHFDLAYCRYVLNHIARDLSEQTSHDILAAIQETLSGSFTSYRIYSRVPILIEASDESYEERTQSP